MENRDSTLAIAIAALTAVSIFLVARHGRGRSKRCHRTSCYLHSEPKPQNSFRRVVVDNSYSQFKHLKLEGSSNDNSSKLHPYKQEIQQLLDKSETHFSFLDGTDDLKTGNSFVWVETEKQLQELADILSKQTVFAVDTEQHGIRSFLGFIALIQISTKEEDYLIDAIALHDFMRILQPVFGDPSICKVFHGADNDVLWLQRDFHIYIVNLFDTAKACDVLSKPQRSLAYLLETYCGITTNKTLQREDWRQRPLPKDMLQYAQTDAHYLLYIANCLIAELKQWNIVNASCPDGKPHFLLEASRRSNMICLQLFTKESEAFPGESAAASILSRNLNVLRGLFPSKFNYIEDLVRQLCTWRDLMARIHDESLRFVLSDQAILALAVKVPRTRAEICDTISQADQDVDSFTSFFPSPSPIIHSHYEELNCLLQGERGNADDFILSILQNHLGPNGTCPLSVFNYPILSKSYKLINKFSKQKINIKNSKQVSRKSSRDLFVQKFSCKSPVYHNCRIYANDGRLLCYCDRRKLEWYLHRDLAKLVDDHPPAIMLLFEPKGRPEDEDNDFYIQAKKNMCVGCGENNHYLRYRIIPSCYRIHFPEHLKSHRSHDIVLLCVDCHEVAHAATEKYKRQIASEFRIPLYVQKVADSRHTEVDSSLPAAVSDLGVGEAGVSPLQLRTAAMALLRHGTKMPAKRREELTEVIAEYYGRKEILTEDIERALLAGMSPHERRRLEKKRGRSLAHTLEVTHPGKVSSNSLKCPTTGILKIDGVDGSHKNAYCTDLDGYFVNNEAIATDSKDVNSEIFRISEADSCGLDDDSYCEDQSLSKGMGDTSNTRCEKPAAPKNNSKFSLLGHSPHGKQVVDHILNEYGEEGLRQFCQRWRQVFVEAVRPRFLPAGWDIKHSGRRDFGEFSVYHPSKKASGDALAG